MILKKQKFLGEFNRYRLIITLGLAVLLPAAALIYVNFSQLQAFKRDKFLEATIHRDFQESLAIDEKNMTKKIYAKVEEARERFPSPDADEGEKEAQLNEILNQCYCFTHAFLFDEQGMVFQTQPSQANDKYVRDEHEYIEDAFRTWFSGKEGKMEVQTIYRRPHHIAFSGDSTKRVDGPAYLYTALFVLPEISTDHVVIGGVVFDPCYMKSNFFPGNNH